MFFFFCLFVCCLGALNSAEITPSDNERTVIGTVIEPLDVKKKTKARKNKPILQTTPSSPSTTTTTTTTTTKMATRLEIGPATPVTPATPATPTTPVTIATRACTCERAFDVVQEREIQTSQLKQSGGAEHVIEYFMNMTSYQLDNFAAQWDNVHSFLKNRQRHRQLPKGTQEEKHPKKTKSNETGLHGEKERELQKEGERELQKEGEREGEREGESEIPTATEREKQYMQSLPTYEPLQWNTFSPVWSIGHQQKLLENPEPLTPIFLPH